MDLKKIREDCGSWNEELEWCDEEFLGECPYREECKKEAESEE